jgi:hypothetical protein
LIFGKFIHLVFQKLLEKLFDIFIAAAFRIFLLLTNLQMLSFKEIQLLPEIFLGISIIYLLIHGTFMSVSPKYLLIQNSVLFLSVLIVSMFCFLLLNNGVECSDFQIFNNTITVDFLSFSSKL